MKADKNRKPSYRDFPPTYEDDKTRMWHVPDLDLNIDRKEAAANCPLGIDIETEELYESRVYRLRSDTEVLVKMLSKRNMKTKILTVYMRVGDRFSEPRTMSEGDYRKMVENFESSAGDILAVEDVVVCGVEYYQGLTKPYIEKIREDDRKRAPP